ncbi:hypothetical protein LIA77_10487 [Sarocladium implicatum]|nr:hypothetical protein LIA77_10487 [Sarocladium implicatum]
MLWPTRAFEGTPMKGCMAVVGEILTQWIGSRGQLEVKDMHDLRKWHQRVTWSSSIANKPRNPAGGFYLADLFPTAAAFLAELPDQCIRTSNKAILACSSASSQCPSCERCGFGSCVVDLGCHLHGRIRGGSDPSCGAPSARLAAPCG